MGLGALLDVHVDGPHGVPLRAAGHLEGARARGVLIEMALEPADLGVALLGEVEIGGRVTALDLEVAGDVAELHAGGEGDGERGGAGLALSRASVGDGSGSLLLAPDARTF